jgi:putative ABC transport system permease protein
MNRKSRQALGVAVDPALSPRQYDVALTPGAGEGSYVNALSSTPGPGYLVIIIIINNNSGGTVFPVVLSLIGLLTLLIAVVAGLGVLSTVVLQTGERVRDLGVFKAIGMTPRQTIVMVVSSVAGSGASAALHLLTVQGQTGR